MSMTKRGTKRGGWNKARLHIAQPLRFWVEWLSETRLARCPELTVRQAKLQVLSDYQEQGCATRYVDAKGRVAWKATDSFLSLLEDLERDAEQDEKDYLDAMS